MHSLVRLTHPLLLPPFKFDTDRKKSNLYLGRLTRISCSRRYGYVESRLALALGTSQNLSETLVRWLSAFFTKQCTFSIHACRFLYSAIRLERPECPNESSD